MSAINKEVFIPKLQIEYLEDPPHIYQITNESAKNFIDSSLLVLMSKNCCTESIRSNSRDDHRSNNSSLENDSQSTSGHQNNISTFLKSEETKDSKSSNYFDKSRLPMSPRDLSTGIAISPRFQQFKYKSVG